MWEVLVIKTLTKENIMDLPIALKTASEKLVVGYKQAQLKKIA